MGVDARVSPLEISADSQPVGTIPAILFSAFQLAFEATVCAIALGGACERGRLLPLFPFAFVSGSPNAI